MTLKLLIALSAVSLTICCNEPAKDARAAKHDAADSVMNCYTYIKNRDTVMLVTINVNGFVTGTLVYNFYEKDKNRGTIQGKMRDSVLIADYTFNAEGRQSVRQVAFKKNGDTFVEGYGDMEDKVEKSSFKNIDSLDFSRSIILSKGKCEK